MSIVTVENITERILSKIPENERNGDDVISILEDLADSLDSEEIDKLKSENASLRDKYISRFMKKIKDDDNEDAIEEDENEDNKIDDLWEE